VGALKLFKIAHNCKKPRQLAFPVRSFYINGMKTRTSAVGRLPITVWIEVDLLRASDEIARARELSRSTYLKGLMAADVARRQSQQGEAAAP
jgi:hypothetical protein